MILLPPLRLFLLYKVLCCKTFLHSPFRFTRYKMCLNRCCKPGSDLKSDFFFVAPHSTSTYPFASEIPFASNYTYAVCHTWYLKHEEAHFHNPHRNRHPVLLDHSTKNSSTKSTIAEDIITQHQNHYHTAPKTPSPKTPSQKTPSLKTASPNTKDTIT
jgi:hypothetical protein